MRKSTGCQENEGNEKSPRTELAGLDCFVPSGTRSQVKSVPLVRHARKSGGSVRGFLYLEFACFLKNLVIELILILCQSHFRGVSNRMNRGQST